MTNFFAFYEVAAKHLKGKFPALKIGGPALCGSEEWGARFLAWCRDRKIPLDFFSWHVYAVDPRRLSEKAVRRRGRRLSRRPWWAASPCRSTC